MAKGIREKIKLVSSAGTGHFYTSTYCTKKLKSNNFSLLVLKNPATAGFFAFCISTEEPCLNYLR